MKLIIQVPCYNEASSLPALLAELPRHVKGFDAVEWLVVDDGSEDATAACAQAGGVDHVIRHPVNRGLSAAYMTGLEAALRLGADVIVNTDADNQYSGADIPTITAPILENRADMVIGERPILESDDFSWIKKRLQRLGSWAVRMASKTRVADAPSGFRAVSREAALRLNVFNAYTYTLETIIQAGQSNLRLLSVPIRTNRSLRPSKLVRSIPDYVRRSVITILRVFATYRPLFLFFWIGFVFVAFGLAAGLRFLWLFLGGAGDGHIQSVVFSALCLIIGALLWMMGFLADLIATNRKLLEQVRVSQRRAEFAIKGRATLGIGEKPRHE